MRSRALAVVMCLAGCHARSSATANDGPPGPGDGAVDAAGDAVTDAPDSAPDAFACRPVQHFSYTSTAAVSLGCDGNAPVMILDEAIPATGRAVGRATFTVQHTGINSVTHFWSISVHVGTQSDAYSLGDDVCPGTTSVRGNLGFGTLTAAADDVALVGYSGAAPCTPGTLQVLAGATLDVWVEDPSATCAGSDIAFGSYYDADGTAAFYDWATSYTSLPGAAASLVTTGASEQVRVVGVVEGTPHLDPNTTCGSEVATVDMGTQLDGSFVTYQRQVVPASQGEGHRVMYTSTDANEIVTVAPGTHTAQLQVATDFVPADGDPVTTGGCCGDGEIALIRLAP